MTFGFQCDELESVAILDAAFDGGITFIDTADIYPNGHAGELAGVTEEIIGRWMMGRRDEVIVASKFFIPMGPNPWNRGGSRKHVLDAIEGSLRRLRTDYLDLYQIHFFDASTPLDETLGALDDLVRVGKVRYIGCSNYAAWQLARALGRSEVMGTARYVSVQPRYNLLFRDIERELLPLCAHDDVAVLPYNPIAGGMLSGKHVAADGPAEGTRFTLGAAADRYRERYWAEDKFQVVEEIRSLAEEAGTSMAQLSLSWVLANQSITAPIVGASRPQHLEAAFAAVAIPLDPDLKTRLDDLTATYRAVDTER